MAEATIDTCDNGLGWVLKLLIDSFREIKSSPTPLVPAS